MTGQPAFFRGYAFRQWEHPEQIYTPQQMRQFDEMMAYLRRRQTPDGSAARPPDTPRTPKSLTRRKPPLTGRFLLEGPPNG